MAATSRVRMLCVDDEPAILEGLVPNLRRKYEVATATSGAAGLEILKGDPAIAVVMSDMRMPGMDGATFLSLARQSRPDAVRMLLTGQSELSAAISAVNEGQIFRFLSKPCPPASLLAAVDAAAEQHRLITTEKVLLEQTLHGCVRTLIDMLAIVNPIGFGRANRIKHCVTDLATHLGHKDRWEVEVAAMFSQLGCITLPAETVEKLYYGQVLSEAELAMVAKMPAATEQLLGNIPRLEGVRAIVSLAAKLPLPLKPGPPVPPTARERGAQILQAAIGFDALEARGDSAALAIDTMRSRSGHYHPEVLEALTVIRGGIARGDVCELPITGLKPGMVIVEDVKMTTGALLVARGFEITAGLIARIQNFKPGSVVEPIRVSRKDA